MPRRNITRAMLTLLLSLGFTACATVEAPQDVDNSETRPLIGLQEFDSDSLDVYSPSLPQAELSNAGLAAAVNEAPVLNRVETSLDRVRPGELVSLRAFAQDGSFVEELEYDWTATGGELFGAHGPRASWRAPAEGGVYVIAVTVRDEHGAEDHYGAEVDVDVCARHHCSGHGVCAALDGQPTCACNPGYRAEGHSCLPAPSGALDELMNGATLVQRVHLGAPVDLEELLNCDTPAHRQGSFVVWEGELADYRRANDSNDGQIAHIPDDVTLRFAVDGTGELAVGVLAPTTAKALAALVQLDLGVARAGTYGDEVRRYNTGLPWHQELDPRWTMMYLALWHAFIQLLDLGVISAGPVTRDDFYALTFAIQNRLQQSVFVVYSANRCCSSAEGCTDQTPTNAAWCPLESADARGGAERGFNLRYSNLTASWLAFGAGGDDGDSLGRISLDGTPQLQLAGRGVRTAALVNVGPESITLTGQRLDGGYVTESAMVFVADTVELNDTWQTPDGGLSSDALPLFDNLEPGWNF